MVIRVPVLRVSVLSLVAIGLSMAFGHAFKSHKNGGQNCVIEKPCKKLFPSAFIREDNCGFSESFQALKWAVKKLEPGPYRVRSIDGWPELQMHRMFSSWIHGSRGPEYEKDVTSQDIFIENRSMTVTVKSEKTTCSW